MHTDRVYFATANADYYITSDTLVVILVYWDEGFCNTNTKQCCIKTNSHRLRLNIDYD